jgi:small-conductance mechanosensitive channel
MCASYPMHSFYTIGKTMVLYLGKVLKFLTVLISIFVLLGIFIYLIGLFLLHLPTFFDTLIDVAFVLITITLVGAEIKKILKLKALSNVTQSKIVLINYFFNLLLYTIASIIILSLFHINLYSLVTSGILIAAIIAIAAQSVIVNVLSGLMIAISNPLRLNQKVWIFPWSSSSPLMTLQLAVFGQKYYSQDVLYTQGVKGIVKDLTLNYVKIYSELDEIVNVPNGLVALGAFQLASRSGRFDIRYEVPKNMSVSKTRETFESVMVTMGLSMEKYNISVDETTLNTYIIRLTVFSIDEVSERGDFIDKLNLVLNPLRIKLVG